MTKRTLDAPWDDDENMPLSEEKEAEEKPQPKPKRKKFKQRKYPGDPGYKPTPSYESGWEHFSPAPGTVQSMKCRVCGKKMKCKRGVVGPTSSVEAMAGRGHAHDTFQCRFAQKDWHVQALSLKKLAVKTPSAVMEKMLLDEAEAIIKSKKATKQVHKNFT